MPASLCSRGGNLLAALVGRNLRQLIASEVLRGGDRTNPVCNAKRSLIRICLFTILYALTDTYIKGVSGDLGSRAGRGIDVEEVNLFSDDGVRRVDCFRLVATEEVEPNPVVDPKPEVSPKPPTSPKGDGFTLVGVPGREEKILRKMSTPRHSYLYMYLTWLGDRQEPVRGGEGRAVPSYAGGRVN